MKISAIIITKNEAHNLSACLESVSFADEIIVVDNSSTDETVQIAKKYGAIVTTTIDWPGFGIQKNRALSQATKKWVLSVDADERITDELAKEIMQVIQHQSTLDCYLIPRLSWYCGKFMHYTAH